MRKFIWLSFDLGVQGDYEGLYKFLDRHGAKECGDSVACFWYETTGNFTDSLTVEIAANVETNGKTRIYTIWMADNNVMKGRFLIGHRKNPPWTGYAESEEQETDSDEDE